MLTVRTPIGHALSSSFRFYSAAASIAAFSFAAVDPQALAEVAGFAGLPGEVPQRGAAGLDGGGEHLLDGVGQDGVFLGGDASGGALRLDARQEQALAGIDVSHADHYVAVHDELL